MTPQELGRRELALLELYCNCQFSMTPQAFYARWGVNQATIARIAGTSISTVSKWFSQGKSRRRPEPIHCRRLAEMHFLWEEYERMPPQLRQQLCPMPRNGKVPSP
jgi:hypothetical protein